MGRLEKTIQNARGSRVEARSRSPSLVGRPEQDLRRQQICTTPRQVLETPFCVSRGGRFGCFISSSLRRARCPEEQQHFKGTPQHAMTIWKQSKTNLDARTVCAVVKKKISAVKASAEADATELGRRALLLSAKRALSPTLAPEKHSGELACSLNSRSQRPGHQGNGSDHRRAQLS